MVLNFLAEVTIFAHLDNKKPDGFNIGFRCSKLELFI